MKSVRKGWRILAKFIVKVGVVVDRYVMCERMVAPLGIILGVK